MNINDELLNKLARLARIKIQDRDKDEMMKDLSEIISWMEQLKELDTRDVEPLANMSKEVDRWREDKVGDHLDKQKALANAPATEKGYFKVPKVLNLKGK